MAGVEADAEALAAAGRLEQRGELAEGAPERPARARRVLQVQRAALGLGQRLADDRAGALDRRADLARLRRAGVQDDAAPRPSAAPTRSEAMSDVSVFARISWSSEAAFSR